MPTDKEIKAELKKKAQQSPEQYYPVNVLKSEGFSRKRCTACGNFFWSVTETRVCGNPECSGGFRFIGNSPARKKLDYVKVWKEFSKLFKKLGYTPIKRYPVTARWRDDTDFVQASIYNFQPYVVSGEVEPPANPLVVPQFCLRFNDIDNVGVTGSHYTGFVMIGQHAFLPEDAWDQEKIFSDIHQWLKLGLGLPNEEVTFHEDAWAGGGNFGPSMEYFSRGLELGNQVYMLYQMTPSGHKNLPLRVCDMGMGHERNAWFSLGKSTSYETTFPPVVEYLKRTTGIALDEQLMRAFLPYASYLNIDETENIDASWKSVSEKVGIDMQTLKKSVLEAAALYSIAEHTRALLVAISDGALPSNVGGGYNLRVILRRALSFADEYGWDVDFGKLVELHGKYLKPLFPELSKNARHVNEILEIEAQRYKQTKEKSRQLVGRIIRADIDEQKLLELYDSYGIAPEIIREEAQKLGKNVSVPDNFYARVAELHKPAMAAEKEGPGVEDLPDTALLYYEDQSMQSFEATVLRIVDNKFVVLNRTCFYPRGGGQEPDFGFIGSSRVYDVEKAGTVVVHHAENPGFKEGDTVKAAIDWERRRQLTQHHTATHIINAAARNVLGGHAFQAGAFKGEQKAHIDITHYNALTDTELETIERSANAIVSKSITSKIRVLPRTDAEKKFGFSVYQGGAVPGRTLRIVEIPHVDAEACGGTHAGNTKDVGEIIILRSERIQDGIVRIEFVAGKAAENYRKKFAELLAESREILQSENVVQATKLLFEEWKHLKKRVEEKVRVRSEKKTDVLRTSFTGNVLVEKLDADMQELQGISKSLSGDDKVLLLFGVKEKIFVFGSAGKASGADIGEIIRRVCEKLGGKGGGLRHLGQGVGYNKELLDNVIEDLKKELSG
ncbi:MAG: alanine--tRNA ligase [Candidatus Aenigmarchaeota archaeon]|nr:alanine--tRNA ligase [Candidatus Aenigmarchaeota archaeon]